MTVHTLLARGHLGFKCTESTLGAGRWTVWKDFPTAIEPRPGTSPLGTFESRMAGKRPIPKILLKNM